MAERERTDNVIHGQFRPSTALQTARGADLMAIEPQQDELRQRIQNSIVQLQSMAESATLTPAAVGELEATVTRMTSQTALAAVPGPAQSRTKLYVGIGLGVAAIGGMIWLGASGKRAGKPAGQATEGPLRVERVKLKRMAGVEKKKPGRPRKAK